MHYWEKRILWATKYVKMERKKKSAKWFETTRLKEGPKDKGDKTEAEDDWKAKASQDPGNSLRKGDTLMESKRVDHDKNENVWEKGMSSQAEVCRRPIKSQWLHDQRRCAI